MLLFREISWEIDDPDLSNIFINDRPIDEGVIDTPIIDELTFTHTLVFPTSLISYGTGDDPHLFEYAFVTYDPGIRTYGELFSAIFNFYQSIDPDTGRKRIEDLNHFVWLLNLDYDRTGIKIELTEEPPERVLIRV